MEGFYNVVITTVPQASHLVQVVGAHRDKDDRHVRSLPNAVAPIKAVVVGQVDVEQHQVDPGSEARLVGPREFAH